MARFLFVFMSLAVIFSFFGEVRASEDVFTVPGVAVDAEGISAAEARETALAQGRKEALRLLFQRLTPKSYWGRLPRISGQESVNVVAGIQVANERTSSTRYLADVSYSFKPNTIRQALRAQGIAFSEAQARDAVVVPVFETLDGTFLWEANNPWTLAWQNKDLTHELVPLLAPLGQIEDIANITLQDVINVNWERLGPFAAGYGVSDVVIAYARWEKTSLSEDLFVRLTRVRGTGTMGASTEPPVEVIVRNTDGLPLEDLLQFAIDQGLQRLQSRWKAQTIIRSDAVENLMRAAVLFENQKDWLSIRQRLNDLAAVKNMEITSLSMNGAEVLLRYVGSLGQLKVTMAQLDLNLGDDGVSMMTIALSTFGANEALSPIVIGETSPFSGGVSRQTLGQSNMPGINSAPNVDVDPGAGHMSGGGGPLN